MWEDSYPFVRKNYVRTRTRKGAQPPHPPLMAAAAEMAALQRHERLRPPSPASGSKTLRAALRAGCSLPHRERQVIRQAGRKATKATPPQASGSRSGNAHLRVTASSSSGHRSHHGPDGCPLTQAPQPAAAQGRVPKNFESLNSFFSEACRSECHQPQPALLTDRQTAEANESMTAELPPTTTTIHAPTWLSRQEPSHHQAPV